MYLERLLVGELHPDIIGHPGTPGLCILGSK